MVRRGAPKKVYGEPGSLGPDPATRGGTRFVAARDFVFYGTPDLSGQREHCEEGEPGEHRAARLPWSEGQAEPRAAGRSPSTGWLLESRVAADTPGKRCGGRGRAPAGAPASWERHPGPAGVQGGVRKNSTVKTARVEGPRPAQEVWEHGSDTWCVDNVLDYDETSLEEGELVDDGTEESWWEQGGVGPANALPKSLQDTRDQTRPRVWVSEEGQCGRRKAQERPPSLPAVKQKGQASEEEKEKKLEKNREE
ncbi:hypothetical protein NDU88_009584 [Pleurodeles waltl]|uniref:Uncharacterized protein n=1 Tax=Pleurodeles waltl TaxID=8319 RepID=A0AAV7PW87_PLEWA|nr:hypothetical protein NDU88_009584 [Pleurodeles waltl]